MRKLYRKSTVHPSPPPSSASISDHLSFLPAAIFILTAALTPEDKEVLAYLLSCSNANSGGFSGQKSGKHSRGCSFSDHCPMFSCNCFRCYMSYWIRWDLSPNRQLIHEIIDAFEDSLVKKMDKGNSKKSRRKKGKSLNMAELTLSELTESDSVKDSETKAAVDDDNGSVDVLDDDEVRFFSDDGVELDKGSMRKFVSFIGERIWGVFGGKENDGK